MTNFLRMAHALSNLGFDVYVFRRFASCGRKGQFFPKLEANRTIIFVDKQTKYVYTCAYEVWNNMASAFGFGTLDYDTKRRCLYYGYEGHGYRCDINEQLDIENLSAFVQETLAEIEDTTPHPRYRRYKATSDSVHYIAEMGYAAGFKFQYQVK